MNRGELFGSAALTVKDYWIIGLVGLPTVLLRGVGLLDEWESVIISYL